MCIKAYESLCCVILCSAGGCCLPFDTRHVLQKLPRTSAKQGREPVSLSFLASLNTSLQACSSCPGCRIRSCLFKINSLQGFENTVVGCDFSGTTVSSASSHHSTELLQSRNDHHASEYRQGIKSKVELQKDTETSQKKS